jgi:mono/diheme cytochrome c family protein
MVKTTSMRSFLTCLALAVLPLIASVNNAVAEGVSADIGKELFTSKCTSCHSIGKGKLIGPDLYGVSERREESWLIKWIQNNQELIKSGDQDAIAIYEEYNKIAMTAFPELSDDDVRSILAYVVEKENEAPAVVVNEVSAEGAAEEESTGSMVMILIGSAILLIMLINLFVRIKNNLKTSAGLETPTLKESTRSYLMSNKYIIVIAVVLVIIGGLNDIWGGLIKVGVHTDYQPEQPIAFSHKVHAGQNDIDCNYCHSSARHSKSSGIPSANVCMNCHNYITEGTVTGTTEISKIYAAVGFDPSTREYIPGYKKQPIKWVRVHNLPDLAYFNHSQHVNVGGLACQECHGPMEEMHEVKQQESLTMGFCIECHRTREVDFENEYYAGLHDKLKSRFGKKDAITVEKIGGLECGKCHY